MRRHLALFIATLSIVAACGGGQAPDAAIVQIRNLTSSVAAVQITEPYSGKQTHGAQPMQLGACSLAYGTAPGNVAVIVSGPSVRGTPSFRAVVATSPQTWITVTIEPDGTVVFGTDELPQNSCAAQDQVAPPSGY
jgi:hypothetical protein